MVFALLPITEELLDLRFILITAVDLLRELVRYIIDYGCQFGGMATWALSFPMTG